MSAHPLRKPAVSDPQPRPSGPSAHMQLMEALGTPPGEGFDPIPPRQLLIGMDVSQSEETRLNHWGLSKSVHGGLAKDRRERTAHFHDDRGDLDVPHAAADLGMERSNTYAAVSRLLAKGWWFRDPKGRLCINGNAPKPVLKRKRKEKAKSVEIDICTDITYKGFSDYFQQLDENRRQQVVAEYVELQKYREQIKAEAIAAAREKGKQLEDEWLAAIGFDKPEQPRGRPKTKREDPAVQLHIVRLPPLPQISVQISPDEENQTSVPISKGHLYESETTSVPIAVSLLNSSEDTESTEFSPPTPSPQPSQLQSESEPSSSEQPTPGNGEPELWSALLFAADQAGMNAPHGQRGEIRSEWARLTGKERKDAIEGIKLRMEIGEYDELRFIPALKRYVKEQLWTGLLRPRKKPSGADTSYLERLIAGEEE